MNFSTTSLFTGNTPQAPATVLWNFQQPMQVQITTPLNANHNYQLIAKDFLEKFSSASSYGMANTGYYYNTDCSITLTIHQGSSNNSTELMGYNNLKNKFTELGINIIKYHGIIHKCQPVGKNSVIVTLYGKTDINNTTYNIMSTFVVRIIQNNFKITNHIFDIFFI